MKAVNLIPADERRGGGGSGSGLASYILIGVLALVVIVAAAYTVVNRSVSDKRHELADVQARVQATSDQAQALQAYTSFSAIKDKRSETVRSLATSRFDWERALHELALVLPGDVWVTSMTASASSDPSSAGGATSGSSAALDSVTGPSLDIHGCASGHDAVAKFLAALRDVDGVTRVSVLSSDRPGAESSSDSSTGSSSSSTSSSGNSVECASRDFIATFEVVAAFDGAQPAATAATPPSSTSPSTPTSTTSTTAVAGGDQTTTPAQPQQSGSGGADQSGGASASAVVSSTGGSP
jgi:Tfp pilus assembly protein PilN